MRGFFGYTDRMLLPDDGKSSSAGNSQPTEQPTTGGEPGTQPSGEPGEQPTAQVSGASRKFTQDEINAARADERRKTEERLKRQQEEAKQVEQGEWQKLAEERQKNLTKLEPEVETLRADKTRLTALLESTLADRVKALPAELVELRPEGDIEAQIVWLVKAEKAAGKLVKERAPAMPGGPRGTGAAATQGSLTDLVETKRKSGIYGGGF